MDFLSQVNLNTTITTVGIIFIAIYQYRTSRSKIASEVISAYEKQVSQYKDQVADFSAKIDLLTKDIAEKNREIGVLQGRILNYEQVLQNRSPELQEILSNIKEFMRKIDERLELNSKEMGVQTQLLKQK